MYKQPITVALKLTDKFYAAFPDKFVPAGFIDKGKTRVGITYTAYHEKRHTLTVLPSLAIIDDALADYPNLNLFAVKEGVTAQQIAEYLQSGATYKKIITTPESFGKVISAARSIGKLEWLYKHVFLYMDEVHCYAAEAFRDNILNPFQWVWSWNRDMIAFGSATPFMFSDPRFGTLPYYKLTYDGKFGKITIVNNANPLGALDYMLRHRDMFPGNVHIFFNSVTLGGEAIRTSGITDVHLFCRDEEKNMVNLGDESKYFRPRPIAGQYAKFNFYSCKYNEGWNLYDDKNATIILVTDVNVPHSLVGIPFKGFQAVGRLNGKPHNIYHITNHFGQSGMKTFKEVQATCIYNATKQIEAYNKHRKDCQQDGMEDDGAFRKMIEQFAAFDQTEVALLYHQRHDQIIYAKYCKQHYNSIATIRETWESLNYDTELRTFDLPPLVRTKKSAAELNKQVIERMIHLRNHPEQYVYEVASTTLAKDKIEFELLFEAVEILGEQEVANLGYENERMRTALIEKSNKNAEAKLRLILIDEYKLNSRHTRKAIKTRLQQLYDELGIVKPDGRKEKATAEQLGGMGLFELKECKVEDEHGKSQHGFEVTKLLFSVKQAA
jgi:hypothetical protein